MSKLVKLVLLAIILIVIFLVARAFLLGLKDEKVEVSPLTWLRNKGRELGKKIQEETEVAEETTQNT